MCADKKKLNGEHYVIPKLDVVSTEEINCLSINANGRFDLPMKRLVSVSLNIKYRVPCSIIQRLARKLQMKTMIIIKRRLHSFQRQRRIP